MPTQRRIRVLVVFGGRSSEHEISIRSAASIMDAVDDARYVAIPAAITRNGRWLGPGESAARLPPGSGDRLGEHEVTVSHEAGASSGFDIVFPALHGPHGEDGKIQGLLEMADVPFVGSGVLGSACGMDKDVMKRLFRERGLPTLPHATVLGGQSADRCSEIGARIGFPAFVKPANLGSSVGIRRVEDSASLQEAIDYACEFDRKVIVEPGVDAREIECAVLGNEQPEASLTGEIVTPDGFYDYTTKYLADDAELVVPAKLAPDQEEGIREMSVRAFQAVGCAGLARVDFFIEKASGRILLNEINTMPGFTSISMFPRLWEASGIPYTELVERLIGLGFDRHARTRTLRYEPE